MLFPSLYNLHMGGLLADTLTIVGSGRSQMDCAAFQAQVRAALTEHLPGDRVEAPVVETFLQRIDYCAVDAGKGTGYDDLAALLGPRMDQPRSEEHTSELQSLMRRSYAVFCLKKK